MVPLAPFRGRQPRWHLYGATGDSDKMENSPAPTAASFVPFSRNDALQERDAVTTPSDSLRVLVKTLRKTAEPIRLKYSPKWYKQWRAWHLLLKPICIFLAHLIAWIRLTPHLVRIFWKTVINSTRGAQPTTNRPCNAYIQLNQPHNAVLR